MTARIAINGFGRIGRCVARIWARGGAPGLELVAVNDVTDAPTLAHLLRYDSIHRTFDQPVTAEDGALRIGSRRVQVLSELDPSRLPWRQLGVDVVLECTGKFTDRSKAAAHLEAGAQRVILSAPGGKDVDGTFCVGINTADYDPARHRVISNASCTTNCLAPIAKVLDETFGILKGHMVTVHAYTNDQRILDLPHKDLRRARAAALSMIPTSTGAARAIGLVLPRLAGKLDGTAIRVPTPNVSLVCLTALVGRTTSRDEVNDALRTAAAGPLRGILAVEDAPLVSSDFVGDERSSVVDAAQTQVIGGDLVEVQAWYDNEWGFSRRLVDLAMHVAGRS
ncbi:MAG: type I glyceraldehyde-3-phosphate dehydrogenase [Myxococcota bacterium]|nr:type I glyceraldehyde-3-phosphate dehydrogenase [Myxococcota bacterium]MDW8362441.1 type I glyceraldehyde-3-phosphate dehydrogenase [Myxococcales bacterium]